MNLDMKKKMYFSVFCFRQITGTSYHLPTPEDYRATLLKCTKAKTKHITTIFKKLKLV